jgi:ABC-type uncharacterized transport system
MAFLRASTEQQPGHRRSLKNLIFHLVLIAVAALCAWASETFPLEYDWTSGNQNTLSTASQDLLKELEGRVRIIAYASNNAKLRGKIRTAVDRFRRFKPDLNLNFVNPDEEPDTVRELGIRVDGELIVHYRGRSEHLQNHGESALSNALFRLANVTERWIVFISGHGERSPSGSANHDLGQFGKQLQNKGFKILELKTAQTGSIPDNAALLVIADPSVGLLPGESNAVIEFVQNGGNLLWLQDSDQLNGLEGLGGLLDIQFLPGVIVDASSRAYGINNPAFVTLSLYPPHPITQNIQATSLFPKSGAIEPGTSGQFRHEPILRSSNQSWSERGPIKGQVQFNPDQGEKQGPLSFGLALSRTIDGTGQRILIVGDSDFLSNTYLGNGVNLDLGLKMIQWLTETGDSIPIPLRFQPDRSLQLTRSDASLMGFVFLIAVPAGLVLTGWIIHHKRKRS